jgi:hypothetical protein
MSLLRRTRTELEGAWRSVRYDMGRRPVTPPAGGPDMTSTGMNTFGGPIVVEFLPEGPVPEPVPGRTPRRAAVVTAFGVLTVVGAAGAYLGVVNGIGSLMHETPAAAGTFPPAVTATLTPNAGIGGVPSPRTTAPPTAAAAPALVMTPAARHVPTGPPNVSPLRTTKKTSPKCACQQPPVPTPTAPASPSPTSSPTGPTSTGPTGSDSASPEPSETSTTPSNSAEPSETPQDRRRHRHQ